MAEPLPPVAPGSGVDRVEEQAREGDARLVRGVRWRLVLFSGGTTLLILLALGALLYVRVASSLQTAGVAQLDARADSLKQFLGGSDDPSNGTPTGLIFGGGSSGTFAILVTAGGQRIGDIDDGVPAGLPNEDSVAAAWQSGRDVRDSTLADVPVRILSETASSRIGPIVIQVIQDRTDEQKTLDVISDVLIFGGLLAVAVAGGFGALYARRALAPIRTSLANQRLALRRQREFAADASHELRTPLTVIRSSVEYLGRHKSEPVASVGEALEDITAEVDQLSTLVEDLLLLARSDSGAIELDQLPLDLGDVAGEAASTLAQPAADRHVRIVVDPEPAAVTGDPVRLRQLVAILVDNAIRHSPAGGEVRVAVRADGRSTDLSVEDEGPGIRPEDLPRVFDRFWRAPGAPAGGTGLGLAIAQWIVERHGGQIVVSNRTGGGARFDVRLPLRPAPAARA
ncbi:MAG TPA: HAMP domain-containing sensor histidine kinase [Candidatus Limnocylindrales bacterium]|nr:HAMP domain-containing sensor histidine kinase [Candidatus Limnocylindrales bacterium]